ncbi:hypothetical protein Ancab_009859, partial [Ancistrocladus abbreviatus]
MRMRNTSRELNKGRWEFGFSRQVKSFFFANYPTDWNINHMWMVFRQYGRVVDIFCPSKGTAGNQYKLARTLDNIWVGTFKLRVSIAKGRKASTNTANNHQNRRLFRTPQLPRKHSPFHDKRSYADVVRQSPGTAAVGGTASDGPHRGKTGQVFKGLVFPSVEENLEWLQGCFVGQTYDIGQ